MRRPAMGDALRDVAVVLCACSLLAALAATATLVAAPPAHAADPRVRTLRERLYLLDGYLEHYANAHYSFYPRASMVRRGKLAAPVWPRDPWTGRGLRPGYGPGHFTYAPAKDRLSYKLTGYYRGGSISLRGSVPGTRKMQNDHRTIEGAQLVQRFIEQWVRSHGGTAPAPSQVAADAAVGAQPGIAWWPHDPWTHQPMGQGDGWSEFSYSVDPRTGDYTMTVHFSRGGTRTFRGPQEWSAPSPPFLSLIPAWDKADAVGMGV